MSHPSLRRLAVPLMICFVLGAPARPGDSASGNRPARPRNLPTLEAWRESRQDLMDAYRETDPAAQAALFEEFLRKHPDGEGRTNALVRLSTALLQSGSTDFARIEGLWQETLRQPLAGCYSLRQFLGACADSETIPLPTARSIFRGAWEKAARDRTAAAGLRPKSSRLEALRGCEECEQALLALEGKLLLRRGDPAGAVPKLREAEKKGVGLGRDLLLVDEAGKTKGVLPTASLDEVRLALAEAYQKTGDVPAAREQLLRVQGFDLGEADRDRARELRDSLGLPAPDTVEVRVPPERAPDLALLDLAGRKVRLRDFRGQVVVLNFWSTT